MRFFRRLMDYPFTEWLVMILAIMAGIVAVKFLLSFLPEGGIVGAVKHVGMAA